jgi:hypothetical protein
MVDALFLAGQWIAGRDGLCPRCFTNWQRKDRACGDRTTCYTEPAECWAQYFQEKADEVSI